MQNEANAILIVEEGEETGRTFNLGPEGIVIGRGEPAPGRIAFTNPFISRRHAEINYSEGCFVLRDLGSTNGTKVNGQELGKLAAYPLEDSDIIELAQGVAMLRFRYSESTIKLDRDKLQKMATRGVIVDEEARDIWVDGQKLAPTLALRDFELLALLCRNRGKACSKEDIACKAWSDEFVTDEQIEQSIHRIRKRIEPDPSNPQRIITLRGYGYKLTEEP